MKESNMPKADFATSILLLVFSATIIILSIRMPSMEEVGANPYSAPGIVPSFLGTILFFLGIILLVRSIRKGGHQVNITRAKIRTFFKNESVIRILLTIFLSVIYAGGLLGNIPYILATFLYVMMFIMIFEYPFDRKLETQEKGFLFFFLQNLLLAGVIAFALRYLFMTIGTNLLTNISDPYLIATIFYVIIFITIFEYRFDRKFAKTKKIHLFSLGQALLISIVVAAVFGYLIKIIGLDYQGTGLLERIPYIMITLIYSSLFVILFQYRFSRKLSRQEKTMFFSFAQAILVSGIVAAVFRYLFLVKLP